MALLIQRLTIKEFKPEFMVSEFASMDYVGSAEFEFGAMPEALRAMSKRLKKLVITDQDGYFLMSLPEEARGYDKLLRNPEIYLKERNSLVARLRRQGLYEWDRDNLWIDIKNHVAMALEAEHLEQLKVAIVNSIKYMDKRAKK